jgi:hypothetical protein
LDPIAASSEAADGTVKINSTFTLRDSVVNLGRAGIEPADGLELRLTTVPAGYRLESDTSQTVAVGQAASWTVTAPPVASDGVDNFTVDIVTPLPDDENTDDTAEIVIDQRTIGIVTESAFVSMADVTDSLIVAKQVVPGLSDQVDMYAFSLMYDAAGDVTANDAQIHEVSVNLQGKDAVQAIDRLYVRINGDTLEVIDPQSATVVVPLSGSNAARMAPNSRVKLIVGVDVTGKGAPDGFSLRINSPDVRDAETDQPLGVEDQAGQGVTDQFQSSLLVVLSGEFAEYVHNYPNPFSPTADDGTNITYFLKQTGDVAITIYDLLGKMVRKFEQSNVAAGDHEWNWNGKNEQDTVVRNGIYVCVVSAGGQTAKFKIAVAK